MAQRKPEVGQAITIEGDRYIIREVTPKEESALEVGNTDVSPQSVTMYHLVLARPHGDVCYRSTRKPDGSYSTPEVLN